MRKIICVLAAFLCFQLSQAQDADPSKMLGDVMGKIFSTKIKLDIDTTEFAHFGNFYMNEYTKSVVMALFVPQSIQKAEQDMAKDMKNKKMKVKGKGKFEANGRKIFYQNGTFKKDGKKLYMVIYAIESTETHSIFLTCFTMKKYWDEFYAQSVQWASSAEVVQETE